MKKLHHLRHHAIPLLSVSTLYHSRLAVKWQYIIISIHPLDIIYCVWHSIV